MKKISTNILALLSSDDIAYFHLVKIGPFKDQNGNTVTWRHTPMEGGITINGEFYTDDNTMLHVDAPRQSAAVDREAFKITYADPGFALRPLFESGFSGVPVEVYIGFYNSTDAAINGVGPDLPFTSPDDLFMIYAGATDSPSYNTNLKEDVVVTIECTSPMGALGMIRSIIINKERLQQINPADTSYDELFTGSKGASLLWGKVS
jgi:hypothetical protein